MGIRDEIQLELAAALDEPDDLGDISRDFEYEDPVTEARTTGRGWRPKLMIGERDGESEQEYDLIFKCLTNELAVEPEIDGVLHINGDDAEYIIKAVSTTASNTTWTMMANG